MHIFAAFVALAVLGVADASAQGGYRCVISSGGQMVYSRAGFKTYAECSSFCSTNALIRSSGGSYQITWRCPPG